ncbi:MAG: monovalent cation/H+ antiporter complex subunit F [Christensenellales bacterium]|nr:monovalent cation/H+ antiporter complex subunit F [Christensenellales bacterium]
MSIDVAYQVLLAVTLGVLTLLALACLVRCIMGPRISDRVLAINMIGTTTVIMVAVTVLLLGEGYLADIALIYAMLSFLAVILLSKVYTGIYHERKHEEELMAQQKEEQNEQKEGTDA